MSYHLSAIYYVYRIINYISLRICRFKNFQRYQKRHWDNYLILHSWLGLLSRALR